MYTIPGITPEALADQETRVIEFGDGERKLFSLPVLGEKGVPMGLVTGAMMLSRALDLVGPERDKELGNAWAFFIDTLATSYPAATRHIASLDFENIRHVMDHWFEKSKELAGFDPKASTSSLS